MGIVYEKIFINTFYIYIGEAGRDNGIATYNGGGKGGYVVPYFEIPNSVIETTYDKYFGNSGGGASDIRLINGNWNDKSSLISRIMVAGGGGGDGIYDYSNQNSSSGGLIGYKGNYYQGHTCLTMDMAYSNARLIAKPESNWLLP